MSVRWIASIAELKSLCGQELGVSDWFEVTQPLIDTFADLTRDHQWIHIDVERARRESPFGTTIAHGFLTLSLMSHLMGQTVRLRGDFRNTINYGFNRVRFPAPVPSGSRIRLRAAVQSAKEFDGGIEVVWDVKVECEGAPKPSISAEWVTRYYLKAE